MGPYTYRAREIYLYASIVTMESFTATFPLVQRYYYPRVGNNGWAGTRAQIIGLMEHTIVLA